MRIEVFDGLSACEPLRDTWNDFAASCGSDISLTFEWHRALESSQSIAQRLKVVWIYEGKQLRGILPLCLTTQMVRSVPLRHLTPLAATYCAHDCLLLPSVSLASIEQSIAAAATEIGRWDALTFVVSDEKPLYSELGIPRASDAFWVEWSESKVSPYLPLEGDIDALSSRLGSKLRSSIRSRTSKLDQAGHVEFTSLGAPSEVTRVMEIVKHVEARSWKQRAGSSITSNPFQITFYDRLLEELAAANALKVSVLSLNGEPIAHEIGFTYKNRYFSGKTSFVEEARHLQPGFLLRWYILKEACAQGLQEHDFMGDDEPHKMQWTRLVRRHRNVRLYRKTALSRLARFLAKYSRQKARNLATTVGAPDSA